ncbi:hypothetical protein [Nesterenkonia sp.]|uniref:hypothetical protein n=1 Tax=Nesterenkonia sp. TaxID=704201 RepID=UPI002631A020|nr:hypothetical protein [Nesterenkonia sp.]
MSIRDESGSALVEFIGLGTLLLIPAVWFLLAVAQVQAASYAAVGAADQATKMYVAAGVPEPERAARSEAAVAAALDDFGLSTEQSQLHRDCSPNCTSEGAVISHTVEIHVPVPLLPHPPGFEHRLVTVTATASDIRTDSP